MIQPKFLWMMLRSKAMIAMSHPPGLLLPDGQQLYTPVDIPTHKLTRKYPLTLNRVLRHRFDP